MRVNHLAQEEIIAALDTALERWAERPDVTDLWRPVCLRQWYEPREVRDKLSGIFHHRLELRLMDNIRKTLPDLIQEEPFGKLLEDWDRFPDVDWSGRKNPDTFQAQVILRKRTEDLGRYVRQRETILREFLPFSDEDRAALQSILRRGVAKLFIRALGPKAAEADIHARRQLLLWEDLNTCFDHGAQQYPLYFLPVGGADARIIAPWTMEEDSSAANYFYAANIIGKIYSCGGPIGHSTLLLPFHEKLNRRILAVMDRDERSREDYDLIELLFLFQQMLNQKRRSIWELGRFHVLYRKYWTAEKTDLAQTRQPVEKPSVGNGLADQ